MVDSGLEVVQPQDVDVERNGLGRHVEGAADVHV